MTHAGYIHKKTVKGIKEFELKNNGLRVLLLEEHTTPVVGVMVTYNVGSRNEALGHTGAAHLLEHLMFKGSKNYNKKKGNDLFGELEDIGAKLNATTWFDRTNYYAVAGSEHLETVIAPEADRMRNAFIKDEDKETEMPVVRSEFEIGENDPHEALDKDIWATAYQAHPYHHSTIGWRSDIENVSIERLQKYYDTYYWPNNATVTIVGDFDPKDALELVKKHFGVHKRSPHSIPEVYTTEPEQLGMRRVEVSRAGNTNIVGVGYKTPPALHKDTFALQVLSSVLCNGKNSRLHRLLVDGGHATSITSFDYPLHDNGLGIIYAFLTPKTKHEYIENEIHKECLKIKKRGITKKELETTKAKIKSEVAFSRDGVYSILSTINESISVGDWAFYTNFLDSLEKVTIDDVKHVANEYIAPEKSTIGYFKGKTA